MRRERGSGSLSDLGDGKYRLRVYVGRDPVTNRPRYASKTIKAKNVTEARKALVAFGAEQEGVKLDSTATVETVMREYIRSLELTRKAPLTVAKARDVTDRIIVPVLGKMTLGELTGRDIDNFVGRYPDLGPASVRRYVSVLSAALALAVRRGWISISPMAQASLPSMKRKELKVPTIAEVRLLMAQLDGPWLVAVELAVVTGARRGELCALRWSDVTDDLLHIRRSVYRITGTTGEKETKGGYERTIALVPAVSDALSGWKSRCEGTAREAGLTLEPDAFVLSTWPDCSKPLNPDTLSARVHRAAERAGVPHVHMHSFRHFATTNILASGIGPRDAAEILGHRDGGRLVLQVYGHATDARQRAASAAMAAALTEGEP